MNTTKRLKRQAKRRAAEAKRNAAIDERYLGRGVKGLNALLLDMVRFHGRGRKEFMPSRRRRSGYTRHTGNGACRTHERQRKVIRAPNTPYRVVLHRSGRWPRAVVATDDQMTARIGYENAVERFGAERLERVGF